MFFGVWRGRSPDTIQLSLHPRPPSLLPMQMINNNKFCFKESQTKGLWPTHLRRNKKCRFSIFHSMCTCLWVSSWATRLSTNKTNQCIPFAVIQNIPLALELISYPNYTSVIRSDIFAFDWCNLVCSSFFQYLNVKVIY